jgi:hypothetical protein
LIGLTEELDSVEHTEGCLVHILHPSAIPEVWDRVAPLLEKAEEHSDGEWLVEDFYGPLLDCQMQLWVAVENGDLLAAMTTEIAHHPRKKVLRIVALGGSGFNKWSKFYPALESFAMRLDCNSLEICTTRKWLKILKDWRESAVVITKDLKGRVH